MEQKYYVVICAGVVALCGFTAYYGTGYFRNSNDGLTKTTTEYGDISSNGQSSNNFVREYLSKVNIFSGNNIDKSL